MRYQYSALAHNGTDWLLQEDTLPEPRKVLKGAAHPPAALTSMASEGWRFLAIDLAGMQDNPQVGVIFLLERPTDTEFVSWDQRNKPVIPAWIGMQDHPEHVLHIASRDKPRFILPTEVDALTKTIEMLWEAGLPRDGIVLEVHPGGILRNPHARAPQFCDQCLPIPPLNSGLEALKSIAAALRG